MKVKRIIYFALTIVMAITIFGFSSQASEDSNNLSYQIDIKIYDLIKNMTVETSNESVENTAVSTDNLAKAENSIVGETKNTNSNTVVKKNAKTNKTPKYPLKDKLFKDIDYIVRKTAHVTLYCLFAIFLALFVKTFKIKNWKAILIVLTIGFLYACLDEYNQKLGGTRTALFKDCLIDTGGCLIGTTLVVAIQALIYKIKNKQKEQS